MILQALIVSILMFFQASLQYNIRRCPIMIDEGAISSLSRFKNAENLDSFTIYNYCSGLSPEFKAALQVSQSQYDIPKLNLTNFLNLTNPILFSFSDAVVKYFTNSQIATSMQSKTLGTVAKADLLARKWVNADIQGTLQESKSNNKMWRKHIVQTAILYQTSYYKRNTAIRCFWERSFRSENSVFNEDVRIQNIEGVTLSMIDTFPQCSITFHLVAWGKLSQVPLEKPKCRRLVSVSKQKQLTSITSNDKEIFAHQCMTLKDLKFQNSKTQIKLIQNVRDVSLPKFLGSEILYQIVKFLDSQYSTVYMSDFYKYTTIKELQVIMGNYYVLRNYKNSLLIPFALTKDPFQQVFAAFNHLYQRNDVESLNFPALFSPEWIVKKLQETMMTHQFLLPALHPDIFLSTSQKRALLFSKLSLADMVRKGEGLSVNDLEACDASLISGIPMKIFERSSETIFKSSSAFTVKNKLKESAPSMNHAQKLTILKLCENVLLNDCMTQNAYKIGLHFFDVMPLNKMINRLNFQNIAGFSQGLSDLGLYRYPDGTFLVNHRELIEFRWSKHHLLAIVESLLEEIDKTRLLSPESVESLGNLSLGILPQDILRMPYMNAFDLIEAFTSQRLIHPSNVRVFAKLLHNSLDELYSPQEWYFSMLPSIFLETFDGFILSQLPMEKWKTLNSSTSTGELVESETYAKNSAICRELVAKVSGSDYLTYMESSKKSNIANFYLLNCRYSLQQEALTENDIDILQDLICFVDESVIRKTDSQLLIDHAHLFQTCCLSNSQSTALFKKFFEEKPIQYYSELVVDHYRFLTSLGSSLLDIVGLEMPSVLNHSKDAVLEVFRNLDVDDRKSECSAMKSWDVTRFNLAIDLADNLARQYLAEMSHRVVMPCYSSVSQGSETLTQAYIEGLPNHLMRIPANRFSKWASDCELLNSLETLAKAHLSDDQKLELKLTIKSLFLRGESYQSSAIPSYNRLGSLLQVFSPEELKSLIDFTDADTIFELGRLDFWTRDQKRAILDNYLSHCYETENPILQTTGTDLSVLGNFLCSLTEEELNKLPARTLVENVATFGRLECLAEEQKSVLLLRYLNDDVNRIQSKSASSSHSKVSPSEISLLGNLLSHFEKCCSTFSAQILTPNNVNSFTPSLFKTLSYDIIDVILSGRSLDSSATRLSDYVTTEQLLVIKERLKTNQNLKISNSLESILTSGDLESFKYKVYIPDEVSEKEDENSPDENDISSSEDDNSLYEYQYSHVIYIFASASMLTSKLLLSALLLLATQCFL